MLTAETTSSVRLVEDELSQELLARAVEVGAATAPFITTEKAPDQSGAFSLEDIIAYGSIYSALGKKLPDVFELYEKKERLAMFPVALGTLASEATISTTTGCWSLVDEWRDEKGYAFIWNPGDYGYRIDQTKQFKGIAVHRMAFNMKRCLNGLPDLTRYQQLDHVCRWPGCCNIDHLEIVDHKKNCRLRDKARQFEAALAAGQIILGPLGKGMEWLDEPLLSCQQEDTNIIITTPTGPFRIIKMDNDPLLFRGQPEFSGLLEIVKPPAPKKYERPSRARSAKVLAGQESLSEPDEYKSKKPTKTKLYKNWQKTGQF